MTEQQVINKLYRELKKKCGDYHTKDTITKWLYDGSFGRIEYPGESYDDQDFDFWFHELVSLWEDDVDAEHNQHLWEDYV